MVCAATAAIVVVGYIAHEIWFCIKKEGDVKQMLGNVGKIVLFTATGAIIGGILGMAFFGTPSSLAGIGALAGALLFLMK